MKTLNVLDWPAYRFRSDTHPLYKWRSKLREHGIKVDFFHKHDSRKLKDADALLIHSRYFDQGWQDVSKRNEQNETELIRWLSEMKDHTAKLIWFDAADSTGSADFPIIPYVDVFVKKQILRDLSYYTRREKLRVWVNIDHSEAANAFQPCPIQHLHKIRVGWNIGLKDFRYYGYKLSRLSNYLSYAVYDNRYVGLTQKRPFNLAFRGRIPEGINHIFRQRHDVLRLIQSLSGPVAAGDPVSKKLYYSELAKSKLSISPFGWGEVCYRDFESFISGSLLIKPSMNHLLTYPAVFKEEETYLPVLWNLEDLKEKLDYALSNYEILKGIAMNGQETFRKAIEDGEAFVGVVKNIML